MAPPQPRSPPRCRRLQPARGWRRALLWAAAAAAVTAQCRSALPGWAFGFAGLTQPHRVRLSVAAPLGSRTLLAARGGEASGVDGGAVSEDARWPQVSYHDLEVGQAVKVRATSVDFRRGKLAVSMRGQTSKLDVGQKHTGIVTRLRDFGAWVDVGAEHDGMLHISSVSKERVDDIHDHLEVGQEVPVWIREVSGDGKFQLTMMEEKKRLFKLKVGQKLTGTVLSLHDYGAWVDVGAERDGLLHISKVSEEHVDDIRDHLEVGQEVHVWVREVMDDGRFQLTMREVMAPLKIKVGQKLTGTVRSILDHAAFVDVGAEHDGLLGIGRVAEERPDDIHDHLHVGQEVQVWVSSLSRDGRFEVTMVEGKLPRKLKVGQKLTGTVRSLHDYGAWVDVGAERDGLLHISKVSEDHVDDIHDYLKVGQEVQVWVREAFSDGRFQLTMVEDALPRPPRKLEVGQKLTGTVRSLHDYGAWVDVGAGTYGMLHVSTVSEEHANDIRDYLEVGEEVQVWVREVRDDGRTILSAQDITPSSRLEFGQKLTGTVRSLNDELGAWVDVGAERYGLLHKSQVTWEFVADIHDHLQVGQEVQVWVRQLKGDGKFELTMKEDPMQTLQRQGDAADLSAFAGVSPDVWLDASVVSLTPNGAVISVSPPGGGAAQETHVQASYIKGGAVETPRKEGVGRLEVEADFVEAE